VSDTLASQSETSLLRRPVGIGAKISLLLCVTTVLACGAVGFTTYWQADKLLVDRELNELSILASVQGARLVTEIDALRSDALFLALAPGVQRAIRARQAGGIDPISNERESELRERIGLTFSGLLCAKPAYFQARLIQTDGGGRETVRVDRLANAEVRIIPDDELQIKRQEPYFDPAMRLSKGEVYLSEINLNREHGRVADPPVPVIRAATTIFGLDDEPAGFVIINRYIDPLIETLKQNISFDSTLLVTNDHGDYLVHPDAKRTFGFDRGTSCRIQDDYSALAPAFAPGADHTFSTVGLSAGGQRVALGLYRASFDPCHPERFVALVLTTPYDKVVAASIHARNRSIESALVVLAASVLFAYVISRSVTRPLRVIAESAAAFGRCETRRQSGQLRSLG
jgi:hypothetical protein